ncbi:MAG: IS110 family transposase [Gemmatimonadetes bacterium]|nr:IS110 family transposase [Gemmatimonadota bacterium]
MKKKTKVYVGMDVHKDTVTIAVLPEGVREPTLVKRMSHDPRGLRRMLNRLAREHEVSACYEASGAGYVLERKIRSWGHECEIVAPSLIPRRPGERRKHDRKDAEGLARLYRAGELVTIRVPTEREERVRDLVRCRGTFQREILKSRHYILKFLARRGLVYRQGKNWTGKHWAWLRAIQRDECVFRRFRSAVPTNRSPKCAITYRTGRGPRSRNC